MNQPSRQNKRINKGGLVSYNRLLANAFVLSSIGHVLLFASFYGFVGPSPSFKAPPKVFSVSVESGSKRGGIQQVPEKKKTKIAPPKKVQKKVAVKKKTETVKAKMKTPPKVVKKSESKKVAVKKTTPKKAVPKKTAPKKTVQKKAVAKKSVPKKPTIKDIDRNLQKAMQRYLGESSNAGGQGFGSSGGGGKGMGGGIVKSPEWLRYYSLLKSSIKSGWNWHNTSQGLKAFVQFRISASGVISDVRLSKGSGNAKFDASILRAVQKASPVPPAPEKVYKDFRFIEMDFQP